MTSFGEIVWDFGGITLRLFTILIILGQIYIVVDAFLQKRRARYLIFAFAQLFAGLFWLFLLLDGSFSDDYVVRERDYFPLIKSIYAAPWLVVLAVNLGLTALFCLSLYRDLHFRHTHLTHIAIKETMDMLPAGLCFASPDGSIALKNQQMEYLCMTLCGRSLFDADDFRQKLDEVGEAQNKATIVTLPNHRAVQFQSERILMNAKPFDQITAYDVSERYQITTQLKEKNRKLIEIQRRMKEYGAMTTQLAMNEEILRARITVHDEMGHLLLSGKYCLDHPDDTDGEKLIRLERYVHQTLMYESLDSNGTVSIDSVIEAVGALGVTVDISGDLPTGEASREILCMAVRECAVNAVKHADGDSLSLSIDNSGTETTAVLHTNGTPPAEPIRESGGLLNLRRSVENAGGTMTITCKPQVTVWLVLPE